MDTTDETSVSGLPLQDTDMVIITIGKNQGANIMTTALFKNLKVKRLISRAINMLHENILKAIGVDEIVHPEEETAERWAKKLCIPNIIDSFELSQDYSIIEIKIPKIFVGKTIREIKLRTHYKLLVLTTIKKTEIESAVGKSISENKVQGVASSDTLLEEDDILVLYGSNKNLKAFTQL